MHTDRIVKKAYITNRFITYQLLLSFSKQVLPGRAVLCFFLLRPRHALNTYTPKVWKGNAILASSSYLPVKHTAGCFMRIFLSEILLPGPHVISPYEVKLQFYITVFMIFH